jgi:CII-binding regulator of phage lambda lysogenization HflD
MSTQKQVQWRRAKSTRNVFTRIQSDKDSNPAEVDETFISKDMAHLRQQAQENLQKHIHEVVPEEYQKMYGGMKQNLKHILEIGEAASDPKVKLEARRIANDCYRYIMDLCTNAGVISDALKFVTQSQQKIDTLQRLEERMQQQQEPAEEETTSGVF